MTAAVRLTGKPLTAINLISDDIGSSGWEVRWLRPRGVCAVVGEARRWKW